ncbi:MAG: hypothetical protein J7507_13980 [Pseudoxanthomonas sp.]|nr:hypothetical protein [Pseudoxanthomonas sp.]
MESEIPQRSGHRYRYPEWLGNLDKAISKEKSRGKGLYIWAVNNDVADICRFVHIGISHKGGSTVAGRTKAHLRGQLRFTDQIRRIAWDGIRFGDLEPDLRQDPDPNKRAQAMSDFLRRLEIFYLFPEDEDSKNQIQYPEGAISHTAAYLLDYEPRRTDESAWQTTNTLSKHKQWEVDPERAARLATLLNEGFGITVLPTSPRRSSATQASLHRLNDSLEY